MLRIKSKRNNFRRCGVAHSDQWVEHPEGRFTAGEIAILKAEPMLQVEIVVPEENKVRHSEREITRTVRM